jgi:hypothetical protein
MSFRNTRCLDWIVEGRVNLCCGCFQVDSVVWSTGSLRSSLVQRAAHVAEVAEGRLAMPGVWRNPARLVVVRNGNPLWIGEKRGGFYFGSLPNSLSGSARTLPDGYAGVLTFDRRELTHTAGPISQMLAR